MTAITSHTTPTMPKNRHEARDNRGALTGPRLRCRQPFRQSAKIGFARLFIEVSQAPLYAFDQRRTLRLCEMAGFVLFAVRQSGQQLIPIVR
jgi:hypothetical protein